MVLDWNLFGWVHRLARLGRGPADGSLCIHWSDVGHKAEAYRTDRSLGHFMGSAGDRQEPVYCPGHDGKNYALNNPFKGNRITYDAEMYQFWRDQARALPNLQTGGPSMGWLYQGFNP